MTIEPELDTGARWLRIERNSGAFSGDLSITIDDEDPIDYDVDGEGNLGIPVPLEATEITLEGDDGTHVITPLLSNSVVWVVYFPLNDEWTSVEIDWEMRGTLSIYNFYGESLEITSGGSWVRTTALGNEDLGDASSTITDGAFSVLSNDVLPDRDDPPGTAETTTGEGNVALVLKTTDGLTTVDSRIFNYKKRDITLLIVGASSKELRTWTLNFFTPSDYYQPIGYNPSLWHLYTDIRAHWNWARKYCMGKLGL